MTSILLRLVPGLIMLAGIGSLMWGGWLATTPAHKSRPSVHQTPAPVHTEPPIAAPIALPPAPDIITSIPPAPTEDPRLDEPDRGESHLPGPPESWPIEPGLAALRPQQPRPRTRPKPLPATAKPVPALPRDWTATPVGPRWPTYMVRARAEADDWSRSVFCCK